MKQKRACFGGLAALPADASEKGRFVEYLRGSKVYKLGDYRNMEHKRDPAETGSLKYSVSGQEDRQIQLA